MKVEREIDVKAPADDLYKVVMDPGRLEDWVSIHERLEEAPQSLRKGSKLTQSLKLAGRKFTVQWTVVENDRPTYVVWEGKGPLGSKARATYEFSESDGVTHFTYSNEYDLPGGPLGKMAGPAVRKVTGKELDTSLSNLRSIVE
jgi:carbon monoxide dehydrogenase subunit G